MMISKKSTNTAAPTTPSCAFPPTEEASQSNAPPVASRKSKRSRSNLYTSFLLLLLLLLVAIQFPLPLGYVVMPWDSSNYVQPSSIGDMNDPQRNITETAGAASKRKPCKQGKDGRSWRIVITANMGYESDLLNWYFFCSKAKLCSNQSVAGLGSEQDGSLADACQPLYAQVVLYAEDVAIYEKYKSSELITVKKAWEVGSKYNNVNLTGDGRFTYSNYARFGQMMSRRPSIVLKELEDAQAHSSDMDLQWSSSKNSSDGGGTINADRHEGQASNVLVLFMDLDTVILKDPRPYFVGDDVDFWAADAMNNYTGPYNAGMLAMRATNASITCVRKWRTALEAQKVATSNQRTFNSMVRKMGDSISHKQLKRNEFPIGKIFEGIGDDALNEHTLGADTVVFHNNYCENRCYKPDRLKKLGLW
eukprot:CAMPEP_0119550362 /NCGR_PEP_ID=MMETSP1352-20130426/3888_1 /TAXON_ID=265584 /ORGANISM="Stauroneis constricta, Strain CCMP1120" /LENGTH=419 /DNA_ID=CAMNT_0007596183 /DNA_START=20 /DNA_END=1276 /DNA_ORIENTATION=+